MGRPRKETQNRRNPTGGKRTPRQKDADGNGRRQGQILGEAPHVKKYDGRAKDSPGQKLARNREKSRDQERKADVRGGSRRTESESKLQC